MTSTNLNWVFNKLPINQKLCNELKAQVVVKIYILTFTTEIRSALSGLSNKENNLYICLLHVNPERTILKIVPTKITSFTGKVFY